MNQEVLQTVIQYTMTGLAALIAIMFHEISHGLAALWLGDRTAKDSKRLSLNPLRHVDIFGLLMLIVVGFGWAKPVPVDMRYFQRPRRDMALVALAGPLMNFLVALVAVIMMVVSVFVSNGYMYSFFQVLLAINLGLGIFNLFPVPPLDGSKMLGAFLPENIYYTVLRYERFGMLALMALLWFGILDKPLGFLRGAATNAYMTLGEMLYSAIYQLIGR